MLLLVRMRTEIFLAVGRFVDFSELGNKAMPCGRAIQDPTILGREFVFVGFHVTIAIDLYRYGFCAPPNAESDVESGKMTAALVPLEMAVLRAISSAPITWLRACLRPPLPVRPLRAGTATAARSPIMPTTARSSTRVKADCSRQGRKGRKGGI